MMMIRQKNKRIVKTPKTDDDFDFDFIHTFWKRI